MTPTALTPAARKAAAAKRAASAAKDAGSHPRRLHRSPTPAAPRRVSGPVSRSTAPAWPAPSSSAPSRSAPPRSAPSRPATRPSPQRSAPSRSRRSASARPGSLIASLTASLSGLRALPRSLTPRLAGHSRVTPARSQPATGPLGARVVARVRTMPEHVIIDRLVRGRAWIPALGLMLAGIVFTQVEILKLGAGIGRSVQQTSVLSARNQQLRASVATLGDDQRIESMAAQMGMIMPAPTAVGFLGGSADIQQALANLIAPAPTRFLNASTSNGAVALGTDLASTGTSVAGAITMAPNGQASTTPTPITPAAGAATTSNGGASSTAGSPTTPAPTTGSSTGPAGTTSVTPASGTSAPPAAGTAGASPAGTTAGSGAGTTTPAAAAPGSSSGGVALGSPSQTNGG